MYILVPVYLQDELEKIKESQEKLQMTIKNIYVPVYLKYSVSAYLCACISLYICIN